MILHSLIKSDLQSQIDDIKNHTSENFKEDIIFHCYWDKGIGANQIISILSCYETNIKGTGNKIILWTKEKENINYDFLEKFCEIRYFDDDVESQGTPLEKSKFNPSLSQSFFSDWVRYVLLIKYRGVWFDLDIFFFKSFAYLVNKYRNFVYTWGKTNYPNGAIYSISDSEVAEKTVAELLKFNNHLGFQRDYQLIGLNSGFDLDVNLNVLPCAWFDPKWIDDDNFESWFFKNSEYFYDDVYCYHWHNRNHIPIQTGSPFYRNILLLKSKLNLG